MPDTQHAVARNRGYRGLAAVPLLRNNEPLGAIAVTRREAGGFTEGEIALLRTFADQAVIAIENARLLSELHEKNDSLTYALEQQTATSDILRVISTSQQISNRYSNSARIHPIRLSVLTAPIVPDTPRVGCSCGDYLDTDDLPVVLFPR